MILPPKLNNTEWASLFFKIYGIKERVEFALKLSLWI